MKWKLPPKIKIYEALGALTDKRIIMSGDRATVRSSSGRKVYQVTYDQNKNAIMANDNGSFWTGYLGYPSIVYLLAKGIITFDKHRTEDLKDIPWKGINTKYKNDYSKTEEEVRRIIEERGGNINGLENEIEAIYKQIKKLNLNLLGKKVKPPTGY